MNIHEHQAKEILADYGVPLVPGKVAYSPEQALACFRELDTPRCVVKAQVHSGARGKAGGIRVCGSDSEVKKAADQLLGSVLVTEQTGPRGQIVQKVYVEAGCEIDREIYLALLLDRADERVVVVSSGRGGMSIEELAAKDPSAIMRTPIDPALGMRTFQARELAFALGLGGDLARPATRLLRGCYEALMQRDAAMVEINPLVVTKDRRLVALDAKVVLDDNALFRHPEIAEMRDKSQEDPRETKASDHDLSYVGLDGNIGCMINGAGLAMATMDMIKHVGGEPANFLDIGGGASPERVTKAFELVLADANVKAMLVNIYAGINRCDWIAAGVIQAMQTLDIKVPLIVRLSGTHVEEGRKMLKDSGLPVITADTLGEAAEKAVAAAGRGKKARRPAAKKKRAAASATRRKAAPKKRKAAPKKRRGA